jgi:hypothetical protein
MGLRVLVSVAFILTATLGAVVPVVAVPAGAATQTSSHLARTNIPDTTPTVDYLMSNKLDGYYRTVTTSTISNASNYAVRAEVGCDNGVNYYGAWESGDGGSTVSCPSGIYADYSLAQYDKTHQYVLDCWFPGDPVDGRCT